MGYGAVVLEVVDEQWLANEFPAEWENLQSKIREVAAIVNSSDSEAVWDDFCREEANQEILDYDEEGLIKMAWEALYEAFGNRYAPLSLYVGNHDSEADGSNLDQVDGSYIAVHNVFQKRPEAETVEFKTVRYVVQC
jgi:hypothetical protein